MVDVDRRPTGPNPAHLAGLRRLSARAASVSAPTVRNGLLSFSALSEKVITHLRNSGHAEFARSDSHSDPVLKKQRSVAEKHSASKCPMPTFSRRSLDAAVDRRRRASPEWLEGYVGLMGSVLREGGWSESDISEMVSGSGSDLGSVLIDNEGVMDELVSKAERFSDSLRKSGWSSEEVSDALGLGFDLQPEKGRRPPKKVSPQLVEKIGKLVESVSGHVTWIWN
ncbi:hypothetical protein LR48_Vigan1345s001100 [Vigna angularis]|uniref:Uncharacterized protein n=2 Tax=Phaseolus angularis TaxID=3914 RepID=A0A0L9TJW1_PHAAN|nr:uncharacterized protein HKW66_Vig0034430 [Vigna angularis]KOM30419.1 hypothetical protein LR48_Vigan1345s001100 [Vigna angularis]BAT75587.1 hypothetical protein VIGAN_01347200 [Vigna angularis var. angularis]